MSVTPPDLRAGDLDRSPRLQAAGLVEAREEDQASRLGERGVADPEGRKRHGEQAHEDERSRDQIQRVVIDLIKS